MKRIVVLTIVLTMLCVGAQSALAYEKGLQFYFGGLDNMNVSPVMDGAIGFKKAMGDDYLLARFGFGLETDTDKSIVDNMSDAKDTDICLSLGVGIQKYLAPEEYQVRPYVSVLGEIEYLSSKEEPSVVDDPTTNTVLEEKSTSMGFGASGAIGAEYFFKPTVSLSAEYSYGLMYTSSKYSQDIQGVTTNDIESSGLDFGPFYAWGMVLTYYWD